MPHISKINIPYNIYKYIVPPLPKIFQNFIEKNKTPSNKQAPYTWILLGNFNNCRLIADAFLYGLFSFIVDSAFYFVKGYTVFFGNVLCIA